MPTVTRRKVLTGAAGAGALATAGYAAHLVFGATGPAATPAPPPRSTPSAGGHGPLVLVTLYGGNDGLNMVVPYADAAYAGSRPGLAVTDAVHLDTALGLHPALAGLKRVWDAGRLAIVLGAGYPNANRSHFRSMDIWQSAVPETDVGSGWLGRWLDTQPHDPMRALSLGPTLPLVLQGVHAAAAAVPAGQLSLPGSDRMARLLATMGATVPGAPPLAVDVARSGADLLTVVHDVAGILASQPTGDAAAGGGNLEPGAPTDGGGQLGAQLEVVARLIKGGAPTQVYAVSLGGFDTHADEKANHDRLMGELDGAITGFLAAVDAVPGVVVAAYSEFGRRVAANASGGTDHGTAAPVFIAGPDVKGGFYGEQPSLTDLDQGDLKFTTDFRSMYATIAEHVLGVEGRDVLNGKRFTPLPFL
jgi:uncharacterized protein (DUF1501 family)